MGKIKYQAHKATISNAGVLTQEKKLTDQGIKRITAMAVTYSDETNIAGSMLNVKLNSQSVFSNEMDAKLLAFNSACPVDNRFFEFPEPIDVNRSSIELVYTDGGNYPAGDTIIYFTFMGETE